MTATIRGVVRGAQWIESIPCQVWYILLVRVKKSHDREYNSLLNPLFMVGRVSGAPNLIFAPYGTPEKVPLMFRFNIRRGIANSNQRNQNNCDESKMHDEFRLEHVFLGITHLSELPTFPSHG